MGGKVGISVQSALLNIAHGNASVDLETTRLLNDRTLSIDEINEGIIDGCLAVNYPNVPRTTVINTLAPIPINSSGKS